MNKLSLSLLMIVSVLPICAMEQMEQPDYSFPKDEYEHYMKLIKEIDPGVYKKLRICEAVNSMQCIEKAVDIEPMVDAGSRETHGYPIMVIKSIKDYSDAGQKAILKIYVDWYNTLEIEPDITPSEQKYLMNIIKSIDPRLYADMVAVDPTGLDHIQRHYQSGAAVVPSMKDGLPLFYVSSYFIKLPVNELRASMAHELSRPFRY